MQRPLLARVFILAIFYSRLSTVTASPLPSIPASALSSDSGAVPAIHGTVSDPWADTLDIDATDPVLGEDGDWVPEDAETVNDDASTGSGVDGMGNAIDNGLYTITSPPPHPKDPPPHTLNRILELGIWKALLGSFVVFWALIATTVAALVAVALRVRSMDRSGDLRRWAVRMETRARRKDDDHYVGD